MSTTASDHRRRGARRSLRAFAQGGMRWVRRGGLSVRVAEVTVAVLAAIAAALAVVVLRASIAFRSGGSIAPALGPVWSAGMVVVALAAYLVQVRAKSRVIVRLAVAALAGAAAGAAMVPLALGLDGTAQPLYTVTGGDMSFRTEYVTRFASSWHLHDYTLRGVHAFYPPAWFWLAGRTAALLGVVPWRIVAPFMVATIGVSLLVAFLLWRAVLRPAAALAAAIGSSLVLPAGGGAHPPWFTGWYSSYSCCVAVVGVAWLAATWETVRRPGLRGRLVVLAVVGAVLALTYYLLFMILVTALLALAVASRGQRATQISRALAVSAGVAALSAVFWVPLVAAVLRGQTTQGHYISPASLAVSLGLNGPIALAVLAVLGVAVLTLTVARPASQAVAALLAGTFLFQLASAVTLFLLRDQLEPYRALTMMWATFGAAVPVALDSFGTRAAPPGDVPASVWRLHARTAAVVAAAAIFVLGGAQGTDLATGKLSRRAHQRVDFAAATAISHYITGITHKRPDELTVLESFLGRPRRMKRKHVAGVPSPAGLMLVTEPYYGFLPLRARFQSPDAHLAQRIAVVRAAAACRRAACTTRVLTHSPFGPVDAVVLRRVKGGYVLYGQTDGFPLPRDVTIFFRPSSFSPATWAQRDFGTDRVFVRRRLLPG
jgi:galactan 5-O-arabinofuranosyltransferase